MTDHETTTRWTRGRVTSAVGAVLLLTFLIGSGWYARGRQGAPRTFEYVSLDDVDDREVHFYNERQGIDLAGLMFVPEGSGPFPAAVIIHGSGTSRRDNGWYLTLVEHLRQQGVLVLLPDKRGSEASGGDWRTSSLEDLATDTLAAIDFLMEEQADQVASVGVIGLSQGGKIAPIVADRSDDVEFLVSVVGGARPMHEELVYEETHNLREMGVLPGLSDLLARPAAWSLIGWRDRTFWSAVGNFDPLPYWRRLDVPALAMFGSQDTNVDSARSARVLRQLDRENIQVVVYEGSGHALESPPGEGRQLFRPKAREDIVRFIRKATAIGSRSEPSRGSQR